GLLVCAPVLIEIAFVVTPEPVARRHHERRASGGAGSCHCRLERSEGRSRIGSVAERSRDAEGCSALVEGSGRGALLGEGAPVAVVLAEERQRQPPASREVRSLEERALVHGTVAEHADGHPATTGPHLRECISGGERCTGADDARAHEQALAVEEMHVATLAATEPVALEQLREELDRVDSGG